MVDKPKNHTALPRESLSNRLLSFIEHPLFLAAFGIIGGIVSLVYRGFLILLGLCIVAAFHRAGVVKGRPRKTQAISYFLIFIGSAATMLWLGNLIKRSVHIPTSSEIADAVSKRLNVPMAPEEAQELLGLDRFISGKDESDLRNFFGFPEMVSLNIEMNKERRLHYMRTGNPNLDLTPYIQGRQMQLDVEYSPGRLKRTEAGFTFIPDINTVPLIVLPRSFTKNKHLLLHWEDSPELPLPVAHRVRELDRDLQENVNILQRVLNIAMLRDPKYFTKHDDEGTKYYRALEERYYSEFIQLRPLCDKILAAIRSSLKEKH